MVTNPRCKECGRLLPIGTKKKKCNICSIGKTKWEAKLDANTKRVKLKW